MTTEPASIRQRVFKTSRNVVSRMVGTESILVPISNNVGDLDYVYTLTPVAARVWALLDGRRTVEDVITQICDEFEVERGEAEADVTQLLSDLEASALISQVETP
jgi:hypothetical protein